MSLGNRAGGLDVAPTSGYTRGVTTSLADLDMPVVLPRWVSSGAVEVVASSRGRVDGGPGYWDDVSLGPLGHRGGPRPWTVRTLARRGCRPGADGGWTTDPPLDRAAATAVVELMLQQIPGGLPADDVRAMVDQAGDTGDRVGRRLADPRTWQRTEADVDGHAFRALVPPASRGLRGGRRPRPRRPARPRSGPARRLGVLPRLAGPGPRGARPVAARWTTDRPCVTLRA